ncbi:MAG TPA: hypothetical protein EYH38_08185, partial [Leucothrix sp.]|nr:hypothetical protein [Leucothrix sp.]
MKNSETKQIEAIECIEEAHKESQNLLAYGRILLNGASTDQTQEPVAYTDCRLGLWLYTDGQVFKGDSWFDEVVNLHEKSHEAYSKLYHETHKIYNPKTHDELQEYYTHLETYSLSLVEQLEKAKEILKNMPEKVTKQAEDLRAELKEELESMPKEHVPLSMTEEAQPQVSMLIETVGHSSDLQKQLKTQHLKQLEHEKQLLELEINQLEERHQLTRRGIEQLKQYQLLKQTEKEQLEDENKQSESVKQKALNTKKLELEDIAKEKQKKQQELEKMEQVSHKLDQKKNEEKVQDEEQLKSLKQEKHEITTAINQINEQEQSKQKDLEQLEKQVLSVQQNIQVLQEEKQNKSEELQAIQDT